MRTVLKTLLGLLLAGALALVALPWWLGLALRPLLRGQGLEFARYERVGFARFAVHDLRSTRAGVRAKAGRVEADNPLGWVWHHFTGGAGPAVVEKWSFEIVPAAAGPTAATPPSVAALQVGVREAAARLAWWLPEAELRDGMVRIQGLAALPVAQVRWTRGTVRAIGLGIAGRRIDLAAGPGATPGTIAVSAASPEDLAQIELEWKGAELEGVANWRGQTARVAAQFGPAGWTPQRAEIVAENWKVPASEVGLEAPFEEVIAGARLAWREGRFELTGEGQARPAPGASVPALTARLAAEGDQSAITISAFELQAPFARATLSAPVVIAFAEAAQAPPARLNVHLDLAGQTWFPSTTGVIDGSVEVGRVGGKVRQRFGLVCRDLRVGEWAVQSVKAEGDLQWPELRVGEVEVRFDDASRATFRGTADLRQRAVLAATGEAQLGAAWLARWISGDTAGTTAEITLEVKGPFQALEHRGSAKVAGFHQPPLRALDAAIEWRGRGGDLEQGEARARSGSAAFRAVAAGSLRDVRLREVSWLINDREVLSLVAPATVTLGAGWRVGSLRFAGTAGELALAGAATGDGWNFRVEAHNLEDGWLRTWTEWTWPASGIERLVASAHTTAGVLAASLELAGSVELAGRQARVALAASGGADGVEVERFAVSDGDGLVLQAAGRMPLTFSGERAPRVRWASDGALRVALETRPEAGLWNELVAPFGLALGAPRARIQIEGTLAQPSGSLELALERVGAVDPAAAPWLPPIEGLSVRARLDDGVVALESFIANVDGHPVRAAGRIPWLFGGEVRGARKWAWPDWRQAEATLEVADFDLRPLAIRLSASPLAKGRVDATVALHRGALTGDVALRDGATRPVESLGVVQDIEAEIGLAGRKLELRRVTGRLGGETVTLQGAADLTTPTAPKLQLGLTGRNLPLVRRAGVLIRSDLDLAVRTAPNGVTAVSGTVNLRDGLVLADLRQFIPTGVRGAERAPPYFAVPQAPFRDWTLEVAIEGPRGVRLHTPVVTGFATPRLRLAGTLGTPRAVGEVSLEAGRILFPFATFAVQLARVRLTEADPFHPRLNLNAATRRYGYELRLEGRGPVGDPRLTLAANPALTSEQVLLLVMAGQVPDTGSGAGPGAGDRKRLTALGAYLGRGLFRSTGSSDPERLVITSGEQMTQQGSETYLVEYLLGRGWSLVGEYDEFDDYNVGVKWRIYGKEAEDGGR